MNSSPVLCRPALPKDTLDVFELTSQIWDGQDYIPYVWQDWLADPQGLLAIAERGGRVVGIGKLTRFASDDWFMEGLRVHPDWQAQGIARKLNEYLLAYWLRYGEGSVRLATASFNIKVHHMCERNGFTRIMELVPYVASALPNEKYNFKLVTQEEYQSVNEAIHHFAAFTVAGGLLDLGWRWARMKAEHLQEVIKENHLWWWRGGQGLLGIWLDEEDENRRPQILMALCPIEQLPSLLLDYRRLAAQLGKVKVGWTAPVEPRTESVLLQAGFTRSWDHSIFIYELNK